MTTEHDELIGMIDDHEEDQEWPLPRSLVIAIGTDAEADAALKIRTEIEAALTAHDVKAKALAENLAAQRRVIERRLEWWQYRFGMNLIAYARSKTDERRRTAQFTWGKVAFRRTPPRSIIMDMPRAVAWMRDRDPERVKVVESVGVKDVLAVADGEVLDWLVTGTEGETIRIETGVNAPAAAGTPSLRPDEPGLDQ